MKKIISIVCVLFAALMLLALPVSAATPYQTYTYSINGTALNSPDAYTPHKTVDAQFMGMYNADFLAKYYPDVALAKAELDTATAAFNKVKLTSKAGEADYAAAETLVNEKSTALNLLVETYGKINLNINSDIETDANGNVYISDTGNKRVIVLDKYYKVKFLIKDFENRNGIMDSFTKPQGVFVTADDALTGKKGKIYVCDTDSSRIVTFDLNGNFIDVIAQPESELFAANAIYRPIALAVDAYNRLYVVSSSTYQGIIVMTDEGEFTGFVGAQQVTISAWDKIWRRFQTEEQRAKDEAYIPTPYNNITLSGDFIYATINLGAEYEGQVIAAITSKAGTYSPVKMLNASGDEIMRRNGFFGPCGEVDNQRVKRSDIIYGSSTIVDVAVGPAKTWSIIDQKRSKVFTYDFDGNLLFAFGDFGRQLGNVTRDALSGIVYHENSMLLLNRTDANFTVYNRTEYGDILVQALQNQIDRQNDQAIKDWKEILKRNSNFDAAYIGIGSALANENKHEEAIESYKSAYDTKNYSISYKELRKEWISKYIILIPILAIALIYGISKFLGFAKKYNKKVSVTKGKRTYIQELMFVFHVIFHPFDGFWDMKHEKRGSVRAGTTILAVTIFAFYYDGIGKGYVMNPTGDYITIMSAVTSVIVPLALWVVSNWCLTTLFDGEGSFKDVYIATTYSLAPLPILMIPATIASNFVVENEVAIITLISAIGFAWAGLLIFFGTMVTHDYSMGKNVITTLGTIVGMVIIMFIAILFSTLLSKMVGFVTNIVTELRYRM